MFGCACGRFPDHSRFCTSDARIVEHHTGYACNQQVIDRDDEGVTVRVAWLSGPLRDWQPSQPVDTTGMAGRLSYHTGTAHTWATEEINPAAH